MTTTHPESPVLAPARCWATRLAEYPATLSVTRDGTSVLAGGLDGELFNLNATTGEIRARWNAHPTGLCCAACGTDLIASGGQDGMLRLWQLDGRLAAEIHLERRWLENLTWSADGQHLAAAAGRTVVLCDARGQVRHRHAHPVPVRTVAFSPNGSLLAIGGGGGVSLLQTRDGRVHGHYVNRSPLLSVAFSPDGRVLACGTGDNEIRFWRLSSGASAGMSGFQGPPFRPLALAWSGSTLASGGDQNIALWKFSGKGPEGRTPAILRGHHDLVTHLAYDPGGKWLASASRDGLLMLSRGAQPLRLAALEAEACALAWHPRRPFVHVADASGQVTAYSVDPLEGAVD